MEQEDTTPAASAQVITPPQRQAIVEIAAAVDKRMRWGILVACCLASAAKLLEPPIWIFNPPRDLPFEASWHDYRMLASFTGLITVTFLLAGGVLGDLYGRRKVLIIGLSGYIAGNLMVMMTLEPGWQLLARFVAIGFGAAAIPLTLAMINITFQDRTMAIAIAIFTITNTLAIQLAWAQGVYFAQIFGWRAPYLLPCFVAVVALIMVARVIPETISGPKRLLDTLIYTGWTLIVLVVFFGLTVWPFDDDRWWLVVGAAAIVGAIGTALIIWWNALITEEKEKPHFRLRDMTALIVTGVILNFALVGYGTRTYAYFQVDQLMTQVNAILALAPILVGSIAGLLLIVNAVRKWQARVVIAGGLLVMAVAMAVTALLPTGVSYLWYIVPLFVFGVGYLVTVTVWISAFLRTAVDGYYGLNAGINKASAMLGAAISAAITGSLLTVLGRSYYQEALEESNISTAQVSAALESFHQVLSANPAEVWPTLTEFHDELVGSYVDAYASAYSGILFLLAGLCALSAIVIGLGLRRSIRAEQLRAREEAESAT